MGARIEKSASGTRLLLVDPGRGIFTMLNNEGRLLLRLSSLGLSLATIKETYGRLAKGDDQRLELEWGTDGFLLSFLSTRVVQEIVQWMPVPG